VECRIQDRLYDIGSDEELKPYQDACGECLPDLRVTLYPDTRFLRQEIDDRDHGPIDDEERPERSKHHLEKPDDYLQCHAWRACRSPWGYTLPPPP
jgi:hypothetical protein